MSLFLVLESKKQKMKIIAFGASTSKTSINKYFATHAAGQFDGHDITLLDLNDYDLPVYSIDIENESGVPDTAKRFYSDLQSADLLIISIAEHNGYFTAAFKNLHDWVSRHEMKMFAGAKMLLLSTSPGAGGAKTALDAAVAKFPYSGSEIVGTFSLPKFGENLKDKDQIQDEDLKAKFDKVITDVKKHFSE